MKQLKSLASRVLASRHLALFVMAILGLCAIATNFLSGSLAGVVQMLAILGFGYMGVRLFATEPDALLRIAAWIFASSFPFYVAEPLINYTSFGPVLSPISRKIADGLIGLAIFTLVVVLLLYAMQALRRRGLTAQSAWSFCAAATRTVFWREPAAENGAINLRLPVATIGIALFLSVVAVALSALPADSWRLAGSGSAGVWNTHVIGTALVRSGLQLADGAIVTSQNLSAYVAIPDSMALNIVKLLHPGAIGAAVFWLNVVTVVGVWLFLIGATLFVEIWIPNRYVASIAVLVFLLLPFGVAFFSAAPFDLGVPLIVAALLATKRLRMPAAALAAIGAALLNVSAGYETAVLVLVLWAFGYIRDSKAAFIVALCGVGSSVLFANLIAAMAPQVSVREAWWNAAGMGQSFTDALTPRSLGAIGLVLVIALTGIYQMVRSRKKNLLLLILTLSVTAAILALPPHLQGTVFIVPATVLEKLSPMGWPSGRFFIVMMFVAIVAPVAFALARLAQRSYYVRYADRMARVLAMVALVVFFFAIVPRQAQTPVPHLAAGVPTVILPIGERGSTAAAVEANALLEDGALILQPIPYFNSSRISYAGPASASTLSDIWRAHAREVVVLYSMYKEPSLVSATPQLYSLRDYLEPRLSAYPHFTIEKIWPEVEVYRVN